MPIKIYLRIPQIFFFIIQPFIHLFISPADCRPATKLPDDTRPLLATAAADIILAATDPEVIPAGVKPVVFRAAGTAAAVPAVQRR